MATPSCIGAFRLFVEEMTGRISFEDIERRFREALDENPVFAEIDKSGALGKNIVVVLGGRGCGKTLLLRYIKHRLAGAGWEFKYINGADIGRLARQQAEKVFQEFLTEQESNLAENPGYRVVVAIDDAAEAVEIAEEFLKKEVELAKKYEGRLKLVLATQSERPGTFILLKRTLPESPHAEMFFGENPRETIIERFKRSYIERRAVALFRGAALINLDAYWSNMRDLDRVEDLASVIVKIAEFYAKNAPSYCAEAVKMIAYASRGLAMMALSTMPKIVSDPHVTGITTLVEHIGAGEGALNGLGIANLLIEFFADPEVRSLAEEAERAYNSLAGRTSSITVDDIERVLLKASASSNIGYMTPLEEIPVRSIVPIQPQLPSSTVATQPLQQPGRRARKYGPRVNAIEVSVGSETRRYIILALLKTDARGYITTSSIKKVSELVELGVPNAGEERYLAVLIPKRKGIEVLYRALGPDHMRRRGHDVLPLLMDGLSELEETFVREVLNKTLPERFQKELAPKILIGTLLLSLRDDRGIPQLAYLMLQPAA